MIKWSDYPLPRESLLEASSIYRDVMRDGLPALHFKPEWEVRIVPPFGCAMMRFWVDHNGKRVSVYADYFEELGYFGHQPYWEMYPRTYANGDGSTYQDVARFGIGDTEGLMKAIEAELNGETAEEATA